ncbi:MAG: pre-peptidase C-terminal domain-containing protein [Granulosicoccus sp.]
MSISTPWQAIRGLLCLLVVTLFCAPLAAQSFDAQINVGDSASGSLAQGQFFHYRLNNPANVASTTVRLNQLSNDIDLYVQYGRLPTLGDYACRSWVSGNSPESCAVDFSSGQTVYIGVNGYESGDYTLSVDSVAGSGTVIRQRSGRIEWNGWNLDYDTFALADGLTLHDVSYEGTPILNQASFPIMSVYYDDNACGPYADRLNGPQASVEWADDALLVAREYTQNGVQWFELGIREFIGSYDIYQVWYFSADGSLDGHVFSRGLQCDIGHIHYPMWRFDFDIDGDGDDHILRETAAGAFTRYTTEFETSATAAYQHGWFVEDALSGYRVRIDFDDGAWNLPGDVVPATAYEDNRIGGMLYKESEKGWTGGPSRFFPYDNGENIDGADIVMWYRGYLPHSPDEGSALWHSTGVRIRTDVQPVIDTDGDGLPDDIDPDDDNDGIPDELDPNPLVPDDVPGVVSIDTTIAVGTDDVEQRGGGRVDFDSSDLELIFDANVNQTIGLRFDELDIPQGANIVRAYLQFQTDERSSGPATLNIHGVASDDAGPWQSTRFDVSRRSRTSTSVSWAPDAWNQVGESAVGQRTPDLAALVEEVVGRSGWQPGNAISFVIQGSGERVAEAYEGSRAGAAKLHVEYESVNGNSAPQADAGPDQSISIAASATLTGSVLDDGLPVPPGEVSILWSKVSGPGDVSFSDASSDTTNALFSAPGTYIIQLTADDGQFRDRETLVVEVQSESGSRIIESRVTSRNDDAEEDTAGAIELRSSDLELGVESTAQTVGIRFNAVDIPPGATITAASIQFTVDEPNRGASSLTIYGEASGNATAFSSAIGNVSSRPQTVSSVDWSPASWTVVGAAGNEQRTPDLSVIVQEIINQNGWSQGNSLVLLVVGSGQRTAESFDGDNSSAPVLRVEFQ